MRRVVSHKDLHIVISIYRQHTDQCLQYEYPEYKSQSIDFFRYYTSWSKLCAYILFAFSVSPAWCYPLQPWGFGVIGSLHFPQVQHSFTVQELG